MGRYSSDDPEVMRQHVRAAKAAGISGFIVSWKSTEVNNRRLRRLADVARAERFTLSVIYQGLDFERHPLPVDRVAQDLRYYADAYAPDPVFRATDRPLLIWSGSWMFSVADMERAIAPIRSTVRVLASEKDEEGYTRVAPVVEGNAYYWSSVDPAQNPDHAAKLASMGQVVHRDRGLWLAPFAPGFDARLLGGTRAVDRRDGQTLREEYAAAVASAPDALGLISWNEFSENTHVEPSEAFGNRYLEVLGDLAEAPLAVLGEPALDSSASSGSSPSPVGGYVLAGFGGGGALLLLGLALLRRRRSGTDRAPRRRRPSTRTVRAGTAIVLVGAATAALLAVRAAPSGGRAGVVKAATTYFAGDKPVRDPAGVVVAAAGDIACAPDTAGPGSEEQNSATRCQEHTTADIVRSMQPDAVLALGDLQYPNGTLERFRTGYDLSWGAFKNITYPVPGNHEYGTRGAAGYFDYFGPAAGAREAGYYSYDLGGWHIVALNSECGRVGGCGPGSPQERWLAADLAAHPAGCTLAYWHRPRFSSGHHGSDPNYAAFWTTLHAAGADLVLGGHDHDYERFAPLAPDGTLDQRGIRQFVVGSGGDSFYKLHEPQAGREVGIASAPGVLRLVLRPGGYEWAFQTADGAPDRGTGECH
nr:metallophosphoesterase [Pseudonocardia acidicola]